MVEARFHLETPVQAFVKPTPRSRKVQCNVCGRDGWPGGSWQKGCIADERFVCDLCGLTFHSKQAVAVHRRHHG